MEQPNEPRVISYNSQMLRDGFTESAAKVYGRIWRGYHFYNEGKDKKNQQPFYPSIDMLREDLVMGKMSVIRALKDLEEAKLIQICRGGYKKRNHYTITNMKRYPAMPSYTSRI